MERNNYKTMFLALILLVSSLALYSQEKKDSLSLEDTIIRMDGGIIYGKVTEVNLAGIKYRMSGIQDGALITLQRDSVYAISFSNHTTQIITPKSIPVVTISTVPEKKASEDYSQESDTSNTFGYNIEHGSLKIGLGYSSEYSSFKGMESYNKTSNTPSFYMAYQFFLNKWLKTGISLGYANLSYSLNESSDYDGMTRSQNLKESITTIGLFGRYDLMKGFVKPYLLAGINFDYTIAEMDGDIYFMENGKHILSTSNMSGLKTNLIARAGLDLLITRRFGLFSDIGTGSTLIQVGVIFGVK